MCPDIFFEDVRPPEKQKVGISRLYFELRWVMVLGGNRHRNLMLRYAEGLR
jgi:hypothetical protein